MKRKAGIVAAGTLAAMVLVVVLIGRDRRVVRNLSPTVGSVVLDSSVHVIALRPVEDMRIDGTRDSLVPINVVRVARNGNVVIGQPQDLKFAFYTPDGRRIGTSGGRGSGPGEFQTLWTMGWVGDTLWVWDRPAQRVTYISAAGKYLGDESFKWLFAAPLDYGRFPAFFELAQPMAVHATGYLVFASPWYRPAGWTYKRPLIAVAPSGMVRRVVADVPISADSDIVSVGTPLNLHSVGVPFRATPQFAVSSDGMRVGYLTTRVDGVSGGALRLTVLARDGDTLVSRAYPFIGTPLPRTAVDSAVEAMIRSSPSSAFSAALAEKLRDQAPRRAPPVYPPVRTLRFGEDSTIWIGLRSTPGGTPWMILDGHGAPIATLTLPPRQTLQASTRTYVWVIEFDADDVPSVVRYRLDATVSR